jgi:hypothetical protein
MAESAKAWSGWRRLWAVLSLLMGAPVLYFAYQPVKHYGYLNDVPKYEVGPRALDWLRGQKKFCGKQSGVWWTTTPVYGNKTITKTYIPSAPPAGSHDWNPPQELWNKPIEQPLYDVNLNCDGALPQDWWWLAFAPAALMAAVGLTARWVYRGFRPVQKT